MVHCDWDRGSCGKCKPFRPLQELVTFNVKFHSVRNKVVTLKGHEFQKPGGK